MVKDYLELIPIINDENTWIINEHNIVIITKEKEGAFKEWIKKNLLKNRKEDEKNIQKREIELDNYGSLVWQKINGKKNIQDIVDEVVIEMGEEKDTACKRATIFFEMLRVHRLINFLK